MTSEFDPRIHVNGFRPEPNRRLRTDNLWSLLEDAIDDAEHMEKVIRRDPKHFGWGMHNFVGFFADDTKEKRVGLPSFDPMNPQGAAYCTMCVAGACMIRRGAIDSATIINNDWHQAIDMMRVGDFHDAYERLFNELPGTVADPVLEAANGRFQELLPPLNQNPHPSNYLSWDDYRKIVEILKAADI